MIFKHADKEDFGAYSVSVTNTAGVSSSYDISAEGRVIPTAFQVIVKLWEWFFFFLKKEKLN